MRRDDQPHGCFVTIICLMIGIVAVIFLLGGWNLMILIAKLFQ